ncbi:hypothetical protein SAMN04487869_1561 [Marinobacter sp. DSM 26671]|uniref:hypothetical protein n=1 Tax=Marinobacter sp. DSM 26671 TaxID=1761793 RepID=UPI0008EC3BAD|nr:hypothetical protein [Marinobacter sp. DSM 26671]PHS47638.1 MAG: hypothetical protein COB05_08575 [Marinobacter sp.]SFF05423.1 hypothetical protein SAMN04487869_1561 [Marinobacter sp. DSM 26671]
MSNTPLRDIQRALEIIRKNVDKSHYDAKLAALELIIDSSKDTVNQIRKARAPDVKKKTVIVPKEKKVNRTAPKFKNNRIDKPMQQEPVEKQPQKPIKPLRPKN